MKKNGSNSDGTRRKIAGKEREDRETVAREIDGSLKEGKSSARFARAS